MTCHKCAGCAPLVLNADDLPRGEGTTTKVPSPYHGFTVDNLYCNAGPREGFGFASGTTSPPNVFFWWVWMGRYAHNSERLLPVCVCQCNICFFTVHHCNFHFYWPRCQHYSANNHCKYTPYLRNSGFFGTARWCSFHELQLQWWS